MIIEYLPDPDQPARKIRVDIPIPPEILKTLNPDKIAEYAADVLAKRYAKVRKWNLNDPQVIVYKQGQYDWIRGWLIEHLLLQIESFKNRVVFSND